MIGKKFMISGMLVEIVSEEGDRWKTRNLTTHETVMFDKLLLERSIKLGKAEEITDFDDTE